MLRVMLRYFRVAAVSFVLASVPVGAQQKAPPGKAAASAPKSPRPLLNAGDRQIIAEMYKAISTEEMMKILEPFNKLDRISGGPGEARAAELLVAALKRYGIEHNVYRFKAYLSWPIRAELQVPGPEARTFRAVTPAFSTSTPPGGLEGECVFIGNPGAIFGPMGSAYKGKEVRGKIVVADGLITPQNARLAEDLGAIGLIHINPRELLHEMIMTTVWGTPTPESAARIPKMPALSITRTDGDWLKQQAQRGPVRVKLLTEVSTKWREIPLVEARVEGQAPGATEEFVLVSSHLDAWYAGMTDTASTDASMLEMARLLHAQRKNLRRSFRFAWWTGHSAGRYAGSTWYADNFWHELNRGCIAYLNLDGPGARSVPLDRVAAWAWPELRDFIRQLARELTGKEAEEGYFAGASAGPFRPFRAGDSSFQGLGIPEVFIGLPEIPAGHPDHAPYVGGSERGWWWHTPEDTLDKIEMKALVRNTELQLAELYTLGTVPVVPYRLTPIAEALQQAMLALPKVARDEVESDLSYELNELVKLAFEADGITANQEVPAGLEWGWNIVISRVARRISALLYSGAGRYDQDPAAPMPLLPGLRNACALAGLDPASDEYGFQHVRCLRERNRTHSELNELHGLLAEQVGTARIMKEQSLRRMPL